MNHSKLPHLDLQDHYQFITFRTYDSLDAYLKKLYETDQDNKHKQHAVDCYLDHSTQGAYFYNDTIEVLKQILLENDGLLYELIAFAIMPNHVHLLLKQKAPINKIMKQIKGKSAAVLNKLLQRKGQFWARDYYDKGIRNQAHFETVYTYILNNPLKVSLSDANARVYSVFGDSLK